MRKRKYSQLLMFALALLFFSWVVLPQPALAVWHVLLNERFDDEPPDWPWGNWELYPDLQWSGG